MHEYDTALKSVLTRLGGDALRRLTGFAIETWHNVELSEVRALRADLLGEAADGTLIHIELQSANDPEMALRMAEYALAIRRKFRRFPEQVVLYVGQAPLNMVTRLTGPAMEFHCRMVDVRDLDGEALLASPNLDDNVLAVLTRVGAERTALRRILDRIAESDPSTRLLVLKELSLLAGLRRLGAIIEEEVKKMPILDDIMDHDLFGPVMRRGMEASREEWRHSLLRQIETRFGGVPEPVKRWVQGASSIALDELSIRLLKVATIEELLP